MQGSLWNLTVEEEPTPIKWEAVQQPDDAYPRYCYQLTLMGKTKETMTLMAYTDELAERQAQSLATLFRCKASLSAPTRVNWDGYRVPWKDRYEADRH